MTVEDLGPITLDTFPKILDKLGARVTVMQQRGRFKWSCVLMGVDWKQRSSFSAEMGRHDNRYGSGEGFSLEAAMRNALKAFLAYEPWDVKKKRERALLRQPSSPSVDTDIDLTLDLGDLK